MINQRELTDALQLVRQLLRNQQECEKSLCASCNDSRKHALELLDFILDKEPVVVKAATHADYLGG